MLMRSCLRDPVPEIAEGARLLDGAVSAHMAGDFEAAGHLIESANMPAIRAYTESIWDREVPICNIALFRFLLQLCHGKRVFICACRVRQKSRNCMRAMAITAASAAFR
jgi:hypothetical protein